MADQPTTRIAFADLSEWVSPQEVAAFLGVSYWTVYMAIQRGEIPFKRFGSKRLFIPRSYLDPQSAQTNSVHASGRL